LRFLEGLCSWYALFVGPVGRSATEKVEGLAGWGQGFRQTVHIGCDACVWMRSQSLEQVVPSAVQGSPKAGEDQNCGQFGSFLDLLEITPAEVRLFGQCLLRQTGRCAEPVDIFSEGPVVGLAHQCRLAGTLIARSAR
jgi:hypothetical protein